MKYIDFDRRRKSKRFGNVDPNSEVIRMSDLGMANEGPYEEVDERRHTYEALSGRDKEASYQEIVKSPNFGHDKGKSVSVV